MSNQIFQRVVHADGKVSAYGCFGHYGHKLDDLSVLEQSQHDESLEEGAPLVKVSPVLRLCFAYSFP